MLIGAKSCKILCLDFDGVLHSYTSPWTGIDIIPDPPVPGAMEFIFKASEEFTIHVFSSRSSTPAGIKAMSDWLHKHLVDELGGVRGYVIWAEIEFPTQKPPAFLTIDDRAILFTGTFPTVSELLGFKPWNK